MASELMSSTVKLRCYSTKNRRSLVVGLRQPTLVLVPNGRLSLGHCRLQGPMTNAHKCYNISAYASYSPSLGLKNAPFPLSALKRTPHHPTLPCLTLGSRASPSTWARCSTSSRCTRTSASAGTSSSSTRSRSSTHSG